MTHKAKLTGAFAGKSVLVTGGAGFTGIWLVAMLRALGANVTSLGLPLTRQDVPAGAGRLTFDPAAGDNIHCDIRDLEALRQHFAASEPQIILHLAAQPLVLDSYNRPYETISSNATGTLNVLEAACGQQSVDRVVVVTSDKVYRNDDRGKAMEEGDALGGSDPYSSSKVAAEAIALGYAQALGGKGPRIGVARAGNIIGGGDWSADRLVPDFMRALAEGKPLLVRNPDATRPWQHVLDAAAGYLLFAAALRGDSGAFAKELCPALNLGPPIEDCVPVSRILNRLNELSGMAAPENERGEDTVQEGREKRLLSLHTGLAEAALNWRPRLRIDAALQLCRDVYAPLIDGQDARQVQEQQVRLYLDALDQP